MPRSLVEPGAVLLALSGTEERALPLIDKAAFERIAKKFHIPECLTDQVRKNICFAAFGYQAIRDFKPCRPSEPSFREIKKELSSVLQTTKRLASQLGCLSPGAQGWIGEAEEIVDCEILISENAESRFGHPILRHKGEDGLATSTYLHLPQIVESISILEKVLDRMLAASRPADKRKKIPDQAVHYFVGKIRYIWEKQLHRDFSFARREGVLQGEAAHFCWALLKLIEPNTDQLKFGSKFDTAMRYAVQDAHPGKGRRPGKSQKPVS